MSPHMNTDIDQTEQSKTEHNIHGNHYMANRDTQTKVMIVVLTKELDFEILMILVPPVVER